MKASEAPKKLYLNWTEYPLNEIQVEYTRTDAFIEKAKEWFIKRNEWINIDGTRQCDMESFEDFKNYMERE